MEDRLLNRFKTLESIIDEEKKAELMRVWEGQGIFALRLTLVR